MLAHYVNHVTVMLTIYLKRSLLAKLGHSSVIKWRKAIIKLMMHIFSSNILLEIYFWVKKSQNCQTILSSWQAAERRVQKWNDYGMFVRQTHCRSQQTVIIGKFFQVRHQRRQTNIVLWLVNKCHIIKP